MDELPLAIQMKLRGMGGAESGVQVVEVILEDGRIVPDVTVMDCAYLEEGATFEPEQVADVRLLAEPPSVAWAVIFLALLLAGIAVMFYLLRALVPD